MSAESDAAKKGLGSIALPKVAFKNKDLLRTGSTMLDLACSGKLAGGLAKGNYYLLIGDSESGKTFLALTCFAEATINKYFKDYRIIFDNAENGAHMDFEFFFGKQVADRVEPPNKNKDGTFRNSETAEDFYDAAEKAFKAGPCIWVLDSENILTTEQDRNKLKKQSKVREKRREGKTVKDEAGTYQMYKPKVHSQRLGELIHAMKKTDSILIIISQTRDNVNAGLFGDPKTRSGGHALKFYATLEFWTSLKQKIKKFVKGKDRVVGRTIRIKVKKNRISGKDRVVHASMYNTVGIDDIGSCIDYLLEEEHWKKSKGQINAKEFNFVGDKEKLIQLIETRDREEELRHITKSVWDEIELGCVVTRKKKYI